MYSIFELVFFLQKTIFINFNIFNQFIFKLNLFKYNIILLITGISLIFISRNNYYWFLYFYFIKNSYKKNYILNNFFLGYYKIHPIIFYISLGLLFIYFFKKQLIKINSEKLLFITITAFFLGSLWALSQTIWGKYWSSDYIEINLLLNYIILVSYIHKLKNNLFLIFFLSLLILLFLRLNLLYTKHNFFNKKKNIYINFYFFYIFLFIYSYNYTYNKIIKTNKKLSLINYLFICIVLINKLNNIFIYNSIKFLFIFFFIMFCLHINKYYYKFFIHYLNIIIILLYINYYFIFFKSYTNYNLYFFKNFYKFYYLKKNNILFFFNKKNYLSLVNKINYKYLFYKNLNVITLYNKKITKIVNYF